MALTTRCPQCGTAFKVVVDQLRVREGLVRCGVCSTVFDGRACLVEPSDSAGLSTPAPGLAWPSEPTAPPPFESVPAVLRGRTDLRPTPEPDDEPEPQFGPEDEPAFRYEPQGPIQSRRSPDARHVYAAEDEPALFAPRRHVMELPPLEEPAEPQFELADDAPLRGDVRLRYDSATDTGRTPPAFLDAGRERHGQVARMLWGYACTLGLMVLLLQLVFVYRNALANAVPQLRPPLEAMCAALDCQVGYARRIERIALTSSSLQPQQSSQAQEDGPVKLMLNVVLRNRYDKPQHWPALLLDLRDVSDTVVVRKIILPEVYLPAERLAEPFAADAEITLAIPIEVVGIHVNGYQIDKFFP